MRLLALEWEHWCARRKILDEQFRAAVSSFRHIYDFNGNVWEGCSDDSDLSRSLQRASKASRDASVQTGASSDDVSGTGHEALGIIRLVFARFESLNGDMMRQYCLHTLWLQGDSDG
jgi:formylglycine-generating enzyme required for sulfatase activity